MNSNKNIIIGTIIVIIVVGGGFLYFKNTLNNSGQSDIYNAGTQNTAPAPETTTTATSSKTIAVTYTNSGFSPAKIEINNGDSVHFINTSSGGMSVASNPHPTHTDYPEFDQYKTSAKGQKEFTFTFTKVGSWGYHNHLNPTMTGTVVVK